MGAMADSPGTITNLLLAWRGGRREALHDLMDQLYPELLRMARQQFRRERRDHTLEPTALVNEAFVRLVDQVRVEWRDRDHFRAVAAGMMRRILVDHARARGRNKRRAEFVRLTDADADATATPATVDVLDLHAALERLEAAGHEMEARVVVLRFFGGLTRDEAAEHLGMSPATIGRAWTFGRTWLYRELRPASEASPGRDGLDDDQGVVEARPVKEP